MSNTILAQPTHVFNTQPTPALPNMGAYALRYAELGYHVIPCHEPLFDNPRGYVCSCEHYRHSDLCRQRDQERKAKGQEPLYLEPDQHCKNPGKHPRGLEHGLKQATNDAATIRKWWRKHPNAPIAHVPGLADLVMLDGDTYKQSYAGADVLTDAERQTLTALSGNLGEHLYYRKHPGATYTNAAGTLPDGIDIRGDNGYALLPPSLHASGRRYAWKDGSNPGQVEPQLLPQRIHDILTAASAKTARTRASFSTPARWDATPSTPAPDLAAWKLSVKTRGMIAHAAPRGERSEYDMRVVQALVYAGAADDDILAVFEHHPIGTAGKFAEAGRRYLERTISAARTYAEEHPRPPDVTAAIVAARAWLHRIDFAQHVPSEKQCSAGYRTRERDLAVADAILEVFEEYGSLEGPLGLRQLRRMANLGGLSTAARALECLTPWFIRPVALEDDAGGDAAHRYELACCVDGTPTTYKSVEGVPSTQHIYGELRHHDAFNATTTPITPEMLAEREYSTRYTLTAIYRRRLAAALPGAGRAALVIVHALVNAGGYMPMGELVGLGGRSKYTISRAVGRLVDLNFVTLDDARGVDLRPDWREWLDKVTDLMPTHGNGQRRIVRDAMATLDACVAKESAAKEAGTAAPGWVEHRRERAERELQRFAPVFWRLHNQRVGAAPTGHYHPQPNGALLVEQLPELRELAYRYGGD